MRQPFSLIFLGFLLFLAPACTQKKESSVEALLQDFTFLCDSQKTYKETLSLKGVNQKELLEEHYQRIFEGLRTIAAQTMMSEALQKNPNERKEFFLSTAKKLGLDSWTCPYF